MSKRVLVWLVVLLVFAGTPAPAATSNEYICARAPASIFEDVATSSQFKPFVDCMAYFRVMLGTSDTTYSPTDLVERWQMALFLQRLWSALAIVPLSGTSQSFTDIASLTPEAKTAINQTAQLSITTGVAPGRFGPTDPVPRWQMAVFLARFAKATGLNLPAPSAPGFVDTTDLSLEARNAISIVKTLGITTGTSANTFSPDDFVTREQMAAFLTRTLQATWFVAASDFSDTCAKDTDGVNICTGSGDYVGRVPIRWVHGWFVELPGDTAALGHSGTKVEFYLDRELQKATEVPVTLASAEYRNWEVPMPSGLTGSHQIEARFYSKGDLVTIYTVTVRFS